MSTIYSWIESEVTATAVNPADSVLIYQSTVGAMAQMPVSTFRKNTVTAVTSAAAVAPGIATLSSASLALTLTAPTAGARVTISALIASTVARTINAGTGSVFYGSTNNVATSTGVQTLELIGLSTSNWGVISNYSPTTGAMTFSTA